MNRLALIGVIISFALIPAPAVFASQPDAPEVSSKKLLHRQWDMARSVIKDEGDAISWKLSSFLTLQGFLFTALSFVISGYLGSLNHEIRDERSRMGRAMFYFGAIICSVGLCSSAISHFAIQAQLSYSHEVADWWDNLRSSVHDSEFPPHIHPSSNQSPGVANWFPRILGFVWIVILVFLLCNHIDFKKPFWKRASKLAVADGGT
jgi:hypothetical protein